METDHDENSFDLSDDLNGKSDCDSGFREATDRKNIDDIAAPSALKFDEANENIENTRKQKLLETALKSPHVTVDEWKRHAKSKGGLINDAIRRHVWPLLVGVREDEKSEAPTLASLSDHAEYNQVVLDVNRSLKRFPPGIPYNQRVALQDQLTVLILRVIMKYPHLKYYQGYHDVAITLLLVCGDKASFPLLCRLSQGKSAPLEPFMQDTMKPTQHRLNYLHPIIRMVHEQLADFLKRSTVGTMFALPWYLTWFGHSLNRYTDVVRLYDYFLCAPPMFPIYVTAAIVLHRSPDIFDLDCDLATLHCFLSKLPEDLPFEDILQKALELYDGHPPEDMEKEVILFELREEQERKEDEERSKRRQVARRTGAGGRPLWSVKLQELRRFINDTPILGMVPPQYRAIFATATLLVGAYAFYKCDYSALNYIR